MSKETDIFIKHIHQRNDFIPWLYDRTDGFIKRDPVKTEIVRKIAQTYISGSNVQGVQNLETFLKHRDTHRLLITSNHQSDADPASRRNFLEHNGFAPVADLLVYPAGDKMMRRWYTRIFMGAEDAIMVPTPFDLQEAKEALKNPLYIPAHQDLLQQYYDRLMMMNEKAKGHLDQVYHDGRIVSLFPESTRTRDGYFKRAPKSVAFYTVESEGQKPLLILPMVVDGINEVFAANSLPKLWKRARLDVRIGEPYLASDLWTRRATRLIREVGATRADLLMEPMVRLKPKCARSEEQDIYTRLRQAA